MYFALSGAGWAHAQDDGNTLLPRDQFDKGDTPEDQANNKRNRDILKRTLPDEVIATVPTADTNAPVLGASKSISSEPQPTKLPDAAATQNPVGRATKLPTDLPEIAVQSAANWKIDKAEISYTDNEKIVTQVYVRLERSDNLPDTKPLVKSARINISDPRDHNAFTSKSVTVTIPAGQYSAIKRKTVVFSPTEDIPELYQQARAFLSIRKNGDVLSDRIPEDHDIIFDLES